MTTLNGLGNRLRAISSAGVVAQKIGYTFVIRWVPDHHCDCQFSNLFQADSLLVSSHPWENGFEQNIKPPDFRPRQDSIPCELEKKIKSLVTNTWDDHKILPLVDDLQTLSITTACILTSKLTSYKEECEWMKKHIRLQASFEKKVQEWVHKWNLSIVLGFIFAEDNLPRSYKYESSENWTPSQREKLQSARGESHFLFFMQEMERIWKGTLPKHFSSVPIGNPLTEPLRSPIPNIKTRFLLFQGMYMIVLSRNFRIVYVI